MLSLGWEVVALGRGHPPGGAQVGKWARTCRVGGSKRPPGSQTRDEVPSGNGGSESGGLQKDFMEQMFKLLSMFKNSGGGEKKSSGDFKRVVLDEKYFRRMQLFAGDASKFRGWFFDLKVAVGQVVLAMLHQWAMVAER